MRDTMPVLKLGVFMAAIHPASSSDAANIQPVAGLSTDSAKGVPPGGIAHLDEEAHAINRTSWIHSMDAAMAKMAKLLLLI